MRKVDLIIALAKAGLPSSEIARQVGSNINSVKVVCSRARAAGEAVPYERERRRLALARPVVTLPPRRAARIEASTGLTVQQVIEAAIRNMDPALPRGARAGSG